MAARKYPEPPLNSLDPADWFMHCDILQDVGAGRALWQTSRRVAESLRESPNLLLMAWVGPFGQSYWRLPDDTSFAPSPHMPYRFAFLKPAWRRIDDYLARLIRISRKSHERIRKWVGTPFQPGCLMMGQLLNRAPRRKVLRAFFSTHARLSLPSIPDTF